MTSLPAFLDLAGCRLELLVEGTAWHGIGGVAVDGQALRDPGLPILPEIRTTEAVELCDWQVRSHEVLPDGGLAITLQPHRRNGGLMEWMLHRVHNRYRVADWTEEPRPADGTWLTIELRPARRSVNGLEGRGFSYRFRYHSDSLPIHRILDRATWEPGGTAANNTFWLRNATMPSIQPLGGPEQHVSSEWWLPGCHNPSIFQFQPFQTQFPGFTLTAADGGCLVTWVDGVAHVRSLFEKPRGWTRMLHLHEHCDDLAHDFATCPVEVLWFPGRRDRTATANLWEGVRAMVHDRLHAVAGIREERVDVYGVIEEWGMPDFARYTREAVPALLAAGVRQVMIPSEFANNMNTWGTGNMCCTVDYRIAESVGKDAVAAFCAALRAGGASVHHWGNTALSTYTWLNANRNGQPAHEGRIAQLPEAGSVVEVMRASRQAFVRNMAGHIEADHYSPVFCQLNLRDPAVTAYWHARWRAARDEVGFGGIFLDSSFNMSSDKFHWVGQVDGSGGATIDQVQHLGHVRPADEPPKAILSQYKAHLALVAAMQGYGYQYSGEDIGVFGIRRSGPDVRARLDNLFMWKDCLAVWDPAALRAAGADPRAVFFRGLAYRCMWMLFWHVPAGELSWRGEGARDDGDRPDAEQLAWLRIFSAVNDEMRGLSILPDEAGALYAGGVRQILWVFRDLAVAADGAEDLLDGRMVAAVAGRVQVQAYRVYVLR